MEPTPEQAGWARRVIESALADEQLMDDVRDGLAVIARGEKGTPGWIVREEARRRDREGKSS